MKKINLENLKERKYYGVPDDIAESIISKHNSLFFSGFDTYTEQSENGDIVATFHYNELDFYRKGLMNKKSA